MEQSQKTCVFVLRLLIDTADAAICVLLYVCQTRCRVQQIWQASRSGQPHIGILAVTT